MLKVLSIFGTRPEAIKMAPVVKELESHRDTFESVVCVTAQHRDILDQVLNLFAITPRHDLDIMTANQDLFDITSHVLQGLKTVLEHERPDLVLVHGDTTTTMAASIAAFYFGAKVAHVEAGLRTGRKLAPFPEEINRRVTGVIADLHFAPTRSARDNLLKEGTPAESVFVTGNTVVDALLCTAETINRDSVIKDSLVSRFSFLDSRKKLILVTAHRRESFGNGFENICLALITLARRYPDTEILYPVHPNPNVREPVTRIVSSTALRNIHIVDPLEYLPFVYLMHRSHIILTDSGGIQEEAPSFGIPVLVMREATERPEAISAGTVKLVGTDTGLIVSAASELLEDKDAYRRMSHARNPYGDGKAAQRIVRVLKGIA